MMEICNFKNILRLLIIIFLRANNSLQEANYGICGDPDCTVPLADGVTTATYNSPDRSILSFMAGKNVTIYVQEYGPKKDLLGVEIESRRGYVPKRFIKETRAIKTEKFPATKAFVSQQSGPAVEESGASVESTPVLETTNVDPSNAQIDDITSHTEIDDLSSHNEMHDATSQHESEHYSDIGATQTGSQLQSSGSVTSVNPSSENVVSQTLQQPLLNSDVASASSTKMPFSSDSPSEDSAKVSSEVPPTRVVDSSVLSAVNSFVSNTVKNVLMERMEEQVKKALDSVAYDQQIQSIDVTPSVKPSETPMPSPTVSENTDDYDKTMKLLMEMCKENGESDCSNIDKLLVDTYTPTVSPSSDSVESHSETFSETLSSDTSSSLLDSTSVHTSLSNSPPSSFDVPSVPIDASSVNSQNVGKDQKSSLYVPSTEKSKLPDDVFEEISTIEENPREEEESDVDEDLDSEYEFRDQDLPSDSTKRKDPFEKSVTKNVAFRVLRASEKYHSPMNFWSVLHDRTSHGDVPRKIDPTDETKLSSVSPSVAEENNGYIESAVKPSHDFPSEQLPAGGTPSSEILDKSFDITSSAFMNEMEPSGNVKIELSQTSSSSWKLHSHDAPSYFVEDKSHDQGGQLEESVIAEATGVSEQHETYSSYGMQHRHILEEGSNKDAENAGPHVSAFSTAESSGDTSDGSIESSYFSVENVKYFFEASMEFFYNSVQALRALLDYIISWAPEPLHSYLMNLNVAGISNRAVVFIAAVGFQLAFLILGSFYFRNKTERHSLTAELIDIERKLFNTNTERLTLLEENKSLREKIADIEKDFAEDRCSTVKIQKMMKNLEDKLQEAKSESEAQQAALSTLTGENEDLKVKLADANSMCEHLSECLKKEEKNSINASESNEKLQEEIEQLIAEKEELIASQEKQKEKIASLEQSCTQLLQEAEIWNTRVSELTEQVYSEAGARKEAEKLIETKDAEIETLKTMVTSIEAVQKLQESGEGESKSLEDSLQSLMDVAKVENQLKKTEELNESLSEKLKQERNKVLEMEVELLESKSEVEKLKMNYNQALQDKAEAQTKLDVLTKYFKDKEMQLQKELGAQEAFRQRKEEDASQAERRMHLIEEENSSYKYQVATLKQEIEETERNLKNQIATQEKKAHENWLAARAAERKMEELKQENAQFRQRLTLLEREQEKWTNSPQGDLIRPVPQRISESGHDVSSSSDGGVPLDFLPRHIPPPPLRHLDDLPLPMRPMPIIPPHGRPLLPPPPSHSPRPLPPPMMPPPFVPPPFDPGAPVMPPHRPQPWNPMQDKRFDAERRSTSSEYNSPSSRRQQTPPYSEGGRQSASPADVNSRSRGSSPVPLPDFHNIPPPLARHEFPPPGQPMRYPGGPPPMMHRREFGHGMSQFRGGNRSERIPSDGISDNRTRTGNQQRQPSEEEV